MSNINGMWDRILDQETLLHLHELSKIDGEQGETNESLVRFFAYVKERIDYKIIVVMTMQWRLYDTMKQAKLAIQYAGEFHASRFMMLMDYLAQRLAEGRL